MLEEEISPTSQRVPLHTDPEVNQRIYRQIEANVAYYARRLEDIDTRLQELDQEWDIERTLQANAGIVSMIGLTLGLFSRRWMLLPIVVAGFLAQHALQGWCPPVPLFRRMGFRTMREIDQERYALKALRGDFKDISDEDILEKAGKTLEAAR